MGDGDIDGRRVPVVWVGSGIFLGGGWDTGTPVLFWRILNNLGF